MVDEGDDQRPARRFDRSDIAVLIGVANFVAIVVVGWLSLSRGDARPGSSGVEVRPGHGAPAAPERPSVEPLRVKVPEGRISQPLKPEKTPEGQVVIPLDEGVTLALIYVPPGRFLRGAGMGAQVSSRQMVTITRGFHIGKYEVTQAQFEAVMGRNPARHKGADRPVAMVFWRDIQEFCLRLSVRTGRMFRLPTEAEWEYACRAGSLAEYCFGHEEARLAEYAWYRDNSGKETHPVGRKLPNALGLYDMHGNVHEYCSDWYREAYGKDAFEDVTVDPTGPETGKRRVLKGGSCVMAANACRCGSKWMGGWPSNANPWTGFRVVMGQPPVRRVEGRQVDGTDQPVDATRRRPQRIGPAPTEKPGGQNELF